MFGSVEITISKEEGQGGGGGGGGGWNESDVMVFMKEISSDGVSALFSNGVKRVLVLINIGNDNRM